MTDERAPTVLVADDDSDIRDLVTFKLESAGYRVVAVGDGEAALDMINKEIPDLALLDVMMPRRSGLDVCRELRENEATASLPIIILTARAHEADVEAGFASGVDDYLVKPFSPKELLTRVQDLLDGGSGEKSTAGPEAD